MTAGDDDDLKAKVDRAKYLRETIPARDQARGQPSRVTETSRLALAEQMRAKLQQPAASKYESRDAADARNVAELADDQARVTVQQSRYTQAMGTLQRETQTEQDERDRVELAAAQRRDTVKTGELPPQPRARRIRPNTESIRPPMGDRDSLRPDRPADLGVPEAQLDPSLDLTPPPEITVPEPSAKVRERRDSASMSPLHQTALAASADLPALVLLVSALRATVADLWARDKLEGAALVAVQDAIDKVWALRNAHRLMLEVAADLEIMKVAIDRLVLREKSGLRAASGLRPVSVVRPVSPNVIEVDHDAKIDELRIQLFGPNGQHGVLGSLRWDNNQTRADVFTIVDDRFNTGNRGVRVLAGISIGVLVIAVGLFFAVLAMLN